MYKTGLFTLDCIDGNCVLKYGKRVIAKNCEEVVNLFLELSITTPQIIEDLDILESEENNLEELLRLAVLDKNMCITK